MVMKIPENYSDRIWHTMTSTTLKRDRCITVLFLLPVLLRRIIQRVAQEHNSCSCSNMRAISSHTFKCLQRRRHTALAARDEDLYAMVYIVVREMHLSTPARILSSRNERIKS